MDNTARRRQQTILAHLKPTGSQEYSAPFVHQLTSSEVSATSGEIVAYSVHPQYPVAILTINNPPVNALANRVLVALNEKVLQAYADKSVKAIVITGGIKGFFVAGADISEIQKMQGTGGGEQAILDFISRNNKTLNSIESGMKPAVAAINGVALGGGLELSMGCNARVCVPSSTLGLPELDLGIIPGFGGTQRLPRLVGVKRSLEMMLEGQKVKAQEALKLGLVDDVVEESKLVARACEIALEMVQFKRQRRKSLFLNTRVEPAPVLEKIIAFAEQKVKQNPHVPHFQACLNAVKGGLEYNGEYGLDIEAKEFLKCALSPTAQAYIHFFFSSRATGKVPGVSADTAARPIKKVAVLGGGLMGSGIIASCLMANMKVILKEVNQQFLDAGVKRVRDIFEGRVQKGRLSKEKFDTYMANLKPQLDFSGFDQLDMVIEAVLEKPELKQQVFQELERVCSPTCILASNTSTIDLNVIGAKTKAQKRIVGLHFFSPAHVMKLLEIIRSEHTDTQVIVDSLAFAKQIQKVPVVVGNCAGFAVNRIFFYYNMATAWLVDRGVDPYRIDKVLMKFGMPLGAFRLGDMTGLDVAIAAGNIMYKAYSNRAYYNHLGNLMIKANRLGQKTGSGFYKHNKGKAEPDTEVANYIAEAKKLAGNPAPIQVTDQDIIDIVIGLTVNEALRVVQEGIVYRASDVDVASILAMGFPIFRGGIIKYGSQVGFDKIYATLSKYHSTSGDSLFTPAELLKELAQGNKNVYAK